MNKLKKLLKRYRNFIYSDNHLVTVMAIIMLVLGILILIYPMFSKMVNEQYAIRQMAEAANKVVNDVGVTIPK